jgi:acetylornithine deacetylase/succinyl-diaminopimelate desuccinylase-like protein
MVQINEGSFTMRRLIISTALLCASTPAIAQMTQAPANKWHAEGRAIFEKAISIPSVSDRPEEVKKLVGYLKTKFETGGLTDVTVKDHDGTQSLIVRWAAAGKAKKKPMLLLGHLDVVDAKREDWPRDSFKMEEKDGYLYGRGAVDMKNGIAAITNALLWLKAEGFKPTRDIVVVFTGDEETSGNGARRAATEWRALTNGEFALNADAGGGGFLKDGTLLGFGLQTSEKMYQSFSFTARNPGGHSSRPRPDNAIYDLAAVLKRLEAYRFSPQMNDTTRAYFTARQKQEKGRLGDAMRSWLANPKDDAAADVIEADPTEVGSTRTRCVATRLEGGHADNALPQTARATVNCRVFPGIEAEAVKAELRAIAGNQAVVEFIDTATPSPPSPLRPDVVKAFTTSIHKRHPGAEIVPQMSAGATDGLFFRGAGIPVYGIDGSWIITPEDERAHGRDERIPVKSFYENLDHWHDVVKALAG